MPKPAQCAECRTEIPKDARFGLCQNCLFRVAVEPGSETAVAENNEFGTNGRRFGDYELGNLLGRGGMGVVYEAVHVSLRRHVALKMILDSQIDAPAARRRFTIEAEAAAKLDHPNIVPVYEVGEHNGQPYLSMKLVKGESLRRILLNGTPLNGVDWKGFSKVDFRHRATEAAKMLAQLARAVHHAHELGVLHRDIKPGNVLIDSEGRPLLTDFGLAKMLDQPSADPSAAPLTVSGAAIGTPSYMSPEQATGKTVGRAADIFSLGAILYELLMGYPPFRGENVVATLRLVADGSVRRPTSIVPHMDRDLETICLKCLERAPEARYSSAGALAEDLERWLRHEPIQARPVHVAARVGRWMRRNVIGSALIVSLFVCLAAALGLWSVAREKQRQSALALANSVDVLSTRVEEMWSNPAETHVDVSSAELAMLVGRDLRPITQQPVKLAVGFAINQNPFGQAVAFSPVFETLEKRMESILHRPVRLSLRLYKLRGSRLPEPVTRGSSDFELIGPLAYIRAREANPSLEPIAKLVIRKDAVIFARVDSGITNLTQVRGHRVAFAHTNSIISFLTKVNLARVGVDSKSLMRQEELDDLVVTPSNQWKVTKEPGGDPIRDVEVFAHRLVVQAVLANQFDVGECPRSHFVRLGAVSNMIRELHHFPVEHFDVMVARAGLPKEYAEALGKSLIDLKDKRSLELLSVLSSSEVLGFTAVTDNDFDSLRSQRDHELKQFELGVSAGAR